MKYLLYGRHGNRHGNRHDNRHHDNTQSVSEHIRSCNKKQCIEMYDIFKPRDLPPPPVLQNQLDNFVSQSNVKMNIANKNRDLCKSILIQNTIKNFNKVLEEIISFTKVRYHNKLDTYYISEIVYKYDCNVQDIKNFLCYRFG